MAVSRIDILNHTLPRAFRGYATAEVDRMLQDAADTLARLGDEKVALQNRVTQLEASLADHLKREEAMRETLVAARRMSEDMRAQAQKEAQLILDAARAKAENMLQQGNARLAGILEEISEARKMKARFETKVRVIAEQHLKLLDMEKEEEERLAAPFSQPPAIGGAGNNGQGKV